MIEHRLGHRSKLPWTPVQLQLTNGGMLFGLAMDISSDGMFIRTPEPPAAGSSVNICVREALESVDASHIGIPALVVHQEGNGVGVMFRELDDSSDTVFQRLHERALA